jgi:hypothetical protein
MNFLKRISTKMGEEHWHLGLVLLFGLMQGLLFWKLVPPWQHYDEPGHFEYAWLLANRKGMPDLDSQDDIMRRELAASMIEHNFFKGKNNPTNLLLRGENIWIGIPQINDRLGYYALVSLVLRIVPTSDITFQLQLGRFISVILYLLTIICAWGIAKEISPPLHPIRWILPLSLTLVPGFVDIMTAVNDDVGATVFFSLFLWAGIHLIVRGFRWMTAVAFLLLAIACFWIKNTVTVAILLIGMPLLFSIFRGSNKRIAWIGIGVSALLLMISAIAWGDAAVWYRYSSPNLGTRASNTQAPLGTNAFRIALLPESNPPRLVQVISPEKLQKFDDNMASFGAWVWADKPIRIRLPILVLGDRTMTKEVQVETEPKFFAQNIKLSSVDSQINVILAPMRSAPAELSTVYYDGILLVEGQRPIDESPKFDDVDGAKGNWGGEPFENLIRNASAEGSWPWVRKWADRFINENFPGRPPLMLAFALDWAPALKYYQQTIRWMPQTFWARFGWGHVALSGFHPYRILAAFTLAGLIGAIFALWRNRRRLPWDVVSFLALPLVIIWGSAFMRGSSTIIDGPLFIPAARYAYPAIIPTMLILCLGWLEIILWIEKYLRIPRIITYSLFGIFFIGLSALSFYSLINFYQV